MYNTRLRGLAPLGVMFAWPHSPSAKTMFTEGRAVALLIFVVAFKNRTRGRRRGVRRIKAALQCRGAMQPSRTAARRRAYPRLGGRSARQRLARLARLDLQTLPRLLRG